MRIEMNTEAALDRHQTGQMGMFALMIVLVTTRTFFEEICKGLLCIAMYFVPSH